MFFMAPRNRAKLKAALKDDFQIRGAEILEIQKKMKEVIIYYVPGKSLFQVLLCSFLANI